MIEIVLIAVVAGVVLGGLAGDARRQQSLRAYGVVIVAYLVAVAGLMWWSGWSLYPWVVPLVISFLVVYVLWLPKKKRPERLEEN